jgi:hypothetical protein
MNRLLQMCKDRRLPDMQGWPLFLINTRLMIIKKRLLHWLLCSILLCLMLPSAYAQYGLGLTRQQVKKMIKKQYKGQGPKPVFTDDWYMLRVTVTSIAEQEDEFSFTFNENDSCWAYSMYFPSDAARQQALQQLLATREEGWQRAFRGFYLSDYKKQMLLTVYNDTPLYHFAIQKFKVTKQRYDDMIARGKRQADSVDRMPDYSVPVVWQPGIKLQWHHYSKYNEIMLRGLQSRLGNKTFCNLYCNIDDKANAGGSAESIPVNIYAVMLPGYSWVLPEDTAKAKLLAYEQLHFDIAELVARQLRRDLSQLILPRAKFRQKIKKMVDEAAITLSKLQQQYDDAVKHNPGSPQMALWQLDIAQKLTELNPYTKHTVEVDIR